VIDGILFCVNCGLRFRSNDPQSALSRRCICSGSLRFDRRETLRELVASHDAPLEILVARVLAING
jgi:hypothetical protein